jgi:hypothetical protein
MTNTTLESRLRKLELRRRQLQIENDIVLPGWLESHLNDGGFAVPCSGRASHYEALPAQQTFHSDLTSRFKGYSGPIGSGKSYALAYEALFLSRLNPWTTRPMPGKTHGLFCWAAA